VRRAATVLAAVLTLLLVQPVASAAQAQLCTSVSSRSAVPAGFAWSLGRQP